MSEIQSSSGPGSPVRSARVNPYRLEEDGRWPNNPRLPLLVYQGAFELAGPDPAAAIEAVLSANGWDHGWRNGIFGFDHYHSTAHEVLCVYGGSARVRVGGPNGPVLEMTPGDVVVLPAGAVHKKLEAGADFRVVGRYPRGQDYDMCYGKAHERPGADASIRAVPLPQADPVYGTRGPLVEHWGLD